LKGQQQGSAESTGTGMNADEQKEGLQIAEKYPIRKTIVPILV
jgi:hypothetical protein